MDAVVMAWRRSALLRAQRAVEVDDKRTFPDDGEDDLLRLIQRVDVTVDQPGWDMEESAFLNLRALLAAGAELEAGAPSHDVPQNIPITVVMPARRSASLGTGTHQRRAAGVERDLAQDTRCRRGDRQALRGNGRDSSVGGHRCQASSRVPPKTMRLDRPGMGSGHVYEHWRRPASRSAFRASPDG